MTLFSGLQLSDLRLDDLDDRQVYRLTARCQVYGTSKNISLCLESDMNYQSHVRQSLHSTQSLNMSVTQLTSVHTVLAGKCSDIQEK